MPRVSEPAVESLSPKLQALFPHYTLGSDHFAEQFRVLAQVEPAAEHLFDMLLTLKNRQGISLRHAELAIIVTSHLNRCQYCVVGHTPRLQVQGLDIEDPQQLIDGTTSAPLTDTDRLVVEYAAAVTQSAQRLPDSLFDRLREVFTESQIVELTLRITLCGFFNRFNQALQIGEGGTTAHAL
ncbi:carboxymuconolactone decarboxylase family protein [Castellaniella sp. S9]|uniref:carboxymuconolactone decarboxylase family protein n=1 Tax=Castellaniella sp. S9 TaxID=2993652 RepID=UPI0022B477ED|nr:carboxymuconolactone decarboxylase family protein [Castellaniella sp. S9]